MSQDTNVENLIINKLTKAQYESIATPDPTQLYFITDEVISSADVTAALGYTPYNATNPAGYISGITSSDVTTALGFTPYNATNPAGYISSAAISSLTDVALTGLANGQVLKYNSTTQKWENSAASGGDNVFIAEWNETTYSEVVTAYDAGKLIFCHYDDGVDELMLPLIGYDSNNDEFHFSGIYESSSYDVSLFHQMSNPWSTLNTTVLDSGANTSLSNLSTTGNNKVNTVLDQSTSSTRLKFWTGTEAAYNSIVSKDSNTLYYLTDTGQIYKGSVLISDKTNLYTTVGQNTDGSMTQKAITDEIYYAAGDTFTVSDYYCQVAACVTSSKTTLQFNIPLPKQIPSGVTPRITSLDMTGRSGSGGYIISNYTLSDADSVSISYINGNTIWVIVTSSTKYQSITNNTGLVLTLRDVTIEFS